MFSKSMKIKDLLAKEKNTKKSFWGTVPLLFLFPQCTCTFDKLTVTPFINNYGFANVMQTLCVLENVIMRKLQNMSV